MKEYYINKGYKLTDRVGLSGIELYYDDYLRGKDAKYRKAVGFEMDDLDHVDEIIG